MSLTNETTPLLNHSQNGGTAIGTDREGVFSDAPYQDDAISEISTCSDAIATDIEANAADTISSSNAVEDSPKLSTSSLIQIVAVLMIGLFVSNIDSSLVLATHPRIGSEFDALEDSSWLFVGFLLGGVATQYATLSDVYGRRTMLVFCYALFGSGCAIIGLSRSMWHVVLGRVLSGSGGSGMGSLLLVLTTDLIPLRDVASWLGYINIVSTTGRSIGGPLGGFLADRVGWRWSFLGQSPFFAIAIIAAILVIPNTKAPPAISDSTDDNNAKSNSSSDRRALSRIDFAGSLLLGAGILQLMLAVEIGGVKVPWTHPVVFGLFAAGAVTLGLFVANEARWAAAPVFPLRLIRNRDILAPYLAIFCIAGAQTSLMYFVPLYFQVTAGASNTLAGFHLVPAVVGNAIGGLVAGFVIRRTGGYKAVILGASLLASAGYALLVIRWQGHTNWWESLYIVPGGFGAGMAGSAVFVSLNAVVEPAHKAVITSGLQLSMPVGMLAGVSAGSAVMLDVLQKVLDKRLLEAGISLESRVEIIQKSIANVDYVRQLPGYLNDIVVGGYLVALRASFGIVLIFSLLGLSAGLLLRERRL